MAGKQSGVAGWPVGWGTGPGQNIRRRNVMKRMLWNNWWCVLALVAIPAALFAASPSRTSKQEPAKSVDLFEGIDSGEVEAVIIFKDATEGTDRKSTRLNSSHLGISYAVFGLK